MSMIANNALPAWNCTVLSVWSDMLSAGSKPGVVGLET